jgi:hypothetical protein
MLFYQEPTAPTLISKTGQFNGGVTSSLVRGTYFPSNNVQWSGNLNGNSECTVIIADTVTLTGTSILSRCGRESVPILIRFNSQPPHAHP